MALAIDDIADWEGFGEEAEALIRKYAPQLLELAYGDASALLDNSSIRWDISNPFIKDVIDTLAVRIRDVSETTKEDVRRWIDVGTEEGLSVQKIAQQIRSNANNITPSRALTIARTESAVAYNQGAVLAYGDAGVQRVEVLDGDEDDVCAAVNGQIWTLEEALADPIAHPNCQRAFAPVVGAVTEEPAQEQPAQDGELGDADAFLADIDAAVALDAINDEDAAYLRNAIANGELDADTMREYHAQARDLVERARSAQAPIPDYLRETTDRRTFNQSTREHYDEWANSLSDDEREALGRYKNTDDYMSLNSRLREGRDLGDKAKLRDDIDTALSRAVLPEDVTVVRGMSFGIDRPAEWEGLRTGSTIQDRGYMSTTFDPKSAEEFGGQYVLHLHVPAGSHAAPIDSFGNQRTGYEGEILVARDSTLHVLRVEPVTSGVSTTVHVYAEVRQ